jgi:hypothetical protein
MKVTIPIGVLLLAVLLGYLLGTESGRAQRDVVLVKLGRKDADEGGDAAPGSA